MYEQLFKLEEDILKVLANQKRLEIVQLLSHGPLSVGEMADMLGLRQPNLSQHLMLLRGQGVVTPRRDGVTVHYELSDPRITEALTPLRQLLKERHPQLSRQSGGLYPVVQDPVCKMRLGKGEAGASLKLGSTTHYFCATGCKEKFVADPDTYVSQRSSEKALTK